jgi:hypothetical protein
MKTLVALLSVALMFAAVSCHKESEKHSGKLTRTNLARLQKGMTVLDVEAILGDDDTRQGGMAPVGGIDMPADRRMWKDGDTWISVSFVGGQAVAWDNHLP